MNLKDQMILDEYRKQKQNYVRLGDTAASLLKDKLGDMKIDIMAVEHRVKKEESLMKKVERKSDKYRFLKDITDILGIRVICFFADDVDRIGKAIEICLRLIGIILSTKELSSTQKVSDTCLYIMYAPFRKDKDIPKKLAE